MGGIVTSYDIGFRVKVEGVNCWVEPMDCDANITWNVREMIEKSTGLPWLNNDNNGLCIDVIPHIERGVKELTEHPDKYKKYEAKNGWGTVESTLRFFQRVLTNWEYFKASYPELVSVATFWIYYEGKFMNKYRVTGSCNITCEMDVFANSKEEAIEIANDEFGELTNYAGMGGTRHIVGVITSDDNRCIYPDTVPEFEYAERIEK